MGGHGGLNILPQKRWNVYNWDNRERVRRDEQEAARKQEQEAQQQQDRDANSRLDKLRTNARARGGSPHASSSDPSHAHAQKDKEVPEAALSTHDGLLELFNDEKTTTLLPSSKRRQHKERERPRDKELERETRRLSKKNHDELEERYRLGGIHSAAQPWYLRSMPPDNPHEVDSFSAAPVGALGGGGGKRKKGVEELRAERLQREESERAKARKLLAPSGSTRKHYNSSFGNR